MSLLLTTKNMKKNKIGAECKHGWQAMGIDMKQSTLLYICTECCKFHATKFEWLSNDFTRDIQE